MSIETYKDIKNLGTTSFTTIPKLIFRTGPFKLKDLPPQILAIYKRTIKLNPGYRFIYFDDRDCLSFIKNVYGEKYVNLYKKLRPTAYKADFWRYLALLHYGGCYGDFSQDVLVPYDQLCKGYRQVLCKEIDEVHNGMYNAFICVTPFNPIIGKTIEICEFNIRNNVDKKNIISINTDHDCLSITGPIALGTAFTIVKPKEKNTRLLKISFQDDEYIRYNNGVKVALRRHKDHYNIVYHNKKKKHYGEYWYGEGIYNELQYA